MHFDGVEVWIDRLLLIATSFVEAATVFPRLDFPVLASGTSQ
jgi:hypothetical protein